MTKVVSIYEAKTNLSKLVKRALAGETIYVGAYGKPQAILSPAPVKKRIPIGIWEHKRIDDANEYENLVQPDPDVFKGTQTRKDNT